MFEFIKKIFIGLLTDIVSASNHKECVSLSNQKCIILPSLIDLLLMNKIKNFTTIHLRLNSIDVLKDVTLLMTSNIFTRKSTYARKTTSVELVRAELQNMFCFSNYILVENLKGAHPERYQAPTPCRL